MQTVCGSEAACADGYSVFCCTINNGSNSCPPNSFIGGWWKADNSSFCGGSARYYIDCNAFRNGAWQCRCAEGTCDQRRVACNQFRYGQCSLDVPASNTGPVVCRVVSCTPPWQQFGGTCTSSSATDNQTATHSAPCLGQTPVGSLDLVAASGGTVHLGGWAMDPDQPAYGNPGRRLSGRHRGRVVQHRQGPGGCQRRLRYRREPRVRLPVRRRRRHPHRSGLRHQRRWRRRKPTPG